MYITKYQLTFEIYENKTLKRDILEMLCQLHCLMPCKCRMVIISNYVLKYLSRSLSKVHKMKLINFLNLSTLRRGDNLPSHGNRSFGSGISCSKPPKITKKCIQRQFWVFLGVRYPLFFWVFALKFWSKIDIFHRYLYRDFFKKFQNPPKIEFFGQIS